MAQESNSVNRLIQRPLYIFDLPEELLYTLQLKSSPAALPATPDEISRRVLAPDTQTINESEDQDERQRSATSCGLCGLTFSDLQEQKRHVRSDLHGYNMKLKLRGNDPVSEEEFERLIVDLEESLSGSDSSESDDIDDDDDELSRTKAKESTLSTLLKKQAKMAGSEAVNAPTKSKQAHGNPPLLWFSSSKLPSNTSLGIYRAIFSSDELSRESRLVEALQRKQLAPTPTISQQQPKSDQGGVPLPSSMLSNSPSSSGPHYFLCMIGGGHFAAMLVSLTPKVNKKSGMEDRSATVLAHKTFHRYTTRRKQGGAQSANDNAKGNAHSAGSSLRRYNEAALTQEVRDLLAEWRPLIESSDLLFIRATGNTNRRTLFGPYEGQVLSLKDSRLRGFPFSTRRATQSELMRSFIELTRVKVSTINEAALAKQGERVKAATAKSGVRPTLKPSLPQTSRPSKEDEEAAIHTTQVQGLIRRSKAPGMLSYLQSNSLSPDFRFFPPEQNRHAPTPLHLAAASNSAACVTALIVKAGADPSIRNEDGRSAFEIAGDRATRDAFRLARSQLGEDSWAWDLAGVPSAITQAEFDSRAAREREEKASEAAAEKQRRQNEVEKLRNEDAERIANAREKRFGKGHIMEKPKMTAEERRMEEARGMSDEMRMKLEREKRARAAEERMKRLQGR